MPQNLIHLCVYRLEVQDAKKASVPLARMIITSAERCLLKDPQLHLPEC